MDPRVMNNFFNYISDTPGAKTADGPSFSTTPGIDTEQATPERVEFNSSPRARAILEEYHHYRAIVQQHGTKPHPRLGVRLERPVQLRDGSVVQPGATLDRDSENIDIEKIERTLLGKKRVLTQFYEAKNDETGHLELQKLVVEDRPGMFNDKQVWTEEVVDLESGKVVREGTQDYLLGTGVTGKALGLATNVLGGGGEGSGQGNIVISREHPLLPGTGIPAPGGLVMRNTDSGTTVISREHPLLPGTGIPAPGGRVIQRSGGTQ